MSETFQLFNLVPETVSGYYGILSFLVAFNLVVAVIAKWSQPSTLDAIPTAGSNTWLGSWWAGFKFPIHGNKVMNKAPFKVAAFFSWIVVLRSHEHIEERRRAPDDTVALDKAIVDAVRTQLTRNVGTLYPELRNEITTAFDDIIDLKGNGWKGVLALNSVQKIICRASNRLFVGVALCRDPDWIDLNIQFTLFVAQGSIIIRMFPKLLKPLVAWFLKRLMHCNERARRLVGPIIEERQKFLNEYGKEWANKPNDFLSWLMNEAKGEDSTVEELTTCVLVLNFAAIHTSATSFTHALLYLAANPQYVQPLREEVETIIREEGWSKAAVSKMHRVDSFFKESLRRDGFSLGVIRATLKNFTLSDGTVIPKDTLVVVPSRVIHYDETYYPNARAFEPFRFSAMHERDRENVKHQFISATNEYLAFGHGQHACPGRFFAAIELKTMLAHILLTYDVKLEDGATHPEAVQLGTMMFPDQNAKVMFRTRVH